MNTLTTLAVLVVYVVAGKLGLALAFVHASATAVWPPAGIALAALLLFGNRVAIAVFAGAFIVNVTTSGSAGVSLAIAVGNTLEALVGAYLVRRFAGGVAVFERAQDIFKLAALAAVASTAVSATIGVASLLLGKHAPWTDAGSIWLTWWLGDAAGILIVTPFIVLWLRRPADPPFTQRAVEALALLASVVGLALLVFGGVLPQSVRNLPIAYVCIPPILWAAYRFGPRETSTAMVVLSAVAIAGTLGGWGPFGGRPPGESLGLLQPFLATIALATLPLAAVVSERRRAFAREGAARAAAEAASRSKDEFLAMLGHELRNPLGAISNAVHVLERARDGAESARAREIMGRQVQHLSRLMDDLLDVARATSGKIALQEQVVDLADLVRRAVRALEANGVMARHEITLDARSVRVRGDAMRLDQVVNNLLENALKYTSPGGRVGVVVEERDGTAILIVEDSGVGIAPDLLPRVFDLFVQADRSLDRTGGGLGIGLTLVRRLVELHGGTVEATSAGVGRGSRFTVRLAAATSTPRDAGAVPEAAAAGARRILVVEDNDDARAMLCQLGRLLGHEVHEAADGLGAVEAALRLRPDLTLVDIGLPGVDGYEVARRIRADPRGHGLRLVALTGYGLREDRERALAVGYDEHLVKPVDPSQMAAMLPA